MLTKISVQCKRHLYDEQGDPLMFVSRRGINVFDQRVHFDRMLMLHLID